MTTIDAHLGGILGTYVEKVLIDLILIVARELWVIEEMECVDMFNVKIV